ncbi:calcium-binding protein [Nocardioides sp. SR21]|uniref:calcium-binding protein n=1 Tax=Nocardioides sp. SR21 TaxID=2919501 RepID=UPI001FAA1AC8|nr:calcium-binding protein [Nocardioides sp. SR21]
MRSRAILLALVVVGASALVAAPAPAAGPCATPTILGTDGDDTLRGTDGPDVIAGYAGDDVLRGLEDDDVLCGGAGQDRLVGGSGADELYGGTDAKVAEDTDYYVYYGDILDGGPGSDILEGGLDTRHEGSVDRVTFEGLPTAVEADLALGTAVSGGDTDTIVGPLNGAAGTDHDDVLLGSGADEILIGGAGSDHLDGRGGDDWVDGGDGAEQRSDRMPNTVLGGAGNDILDGDRGDDLLRGGPGGDLVQADTGVDRSYGGTGNDTVNDEAGPDPGQVIDGGPGRDYLGGIALLDGGGTFRPRVAGRIDLAAGTLRARLDEVRWSVALRNMEDVSSQRGAWTLYGTDGPDYLSAGFLREPVRIFGRGGNDQLYGSDGDDLLNGGPGRDRGSGWAGHDRIVSVERLRR